MNMQESTPQRSKDVRVFHNTLLAWITKVATCWERLVHMNLEGFAVEVERGYRRELLHSPISREELNRLERAILEAHAARNEYPGHDKNRDAKREQTIRTQILHLLEKKCDSRPQLEVVC